VRFVLLLLLLSSACGSPERGFESFYAAMVDGSPRALEHLTRSSRLAVEEQARLHATTPEHMLHAASVRSTLRAVKEIERAGDDRAILLVTDALGKTERVTMVREDGRWRVELFQ
jgi:hypothetical protein